MIVIGLDEHCRAAEVSGSTKILIHRIQLCPSDPTIPFKLYRRRFLVKIAFPMAINVAQEQIKKYVRPSTVFSNGQLYVAFYRTYSFDSVTFQLLKSIDEVRKITD
jgi:hypothetical protein